MKTISVVILCHNNKGISICLQAILRQLSQNDEVIVVDDHSEQSFLNHELAAYWKHKSVRICPVFQQRGNRSYNRNFGAQHSEKDILLFLDGDMVPAPGMVEAFRNAHDNEDYVAFIGCAHGMRFDEEHLQLHIGHRHYRDMVQTEEGLRQLVQNPCLEDWRTQPFHQPELEPYYWIYYYTCICSAQRTVFREIGGFDEALVTWGSEDIDLGYRLHACGKIGCLTDAHAVHLPHQRNLWDEQLFDRDNIRYLLDKHRTWPFELLLSFDLSAEIYQNIQQMRDEITQWDLLRITPVPIPGTLWLNAPSVQHTKDTVTWYSDSLGMSALELFGMALPCCDQFFEAAYVSSHIFSYPMVMTSRILQECMRISRRVVVLPAPGSRRKAWEWEFLLQEREINRNYYLSSDTMEFEFHPLGDGGYQVFSPQVAARKSASRSQCPVLLSAQSRQIWHQKIIKTALPQLTLVNLVECDTDELKRTLERAMGIPFEQSYQFSVPVDGMISLTEDIPAALADCKSGILFFVYSHHAVRQSSVEQWLRRRNAPDFLLEMGGTLFRLGKDRLISLAVPKDRLEE